MYGTDWQDVDLAHCLILIRHGKNGDSRYARLNSIALKALTEVRKRSDGSGAVIRNLQGERWPGRAIGLRSPFRKPEQRIFTGTTCATRLRPV